MGNALRKKGADGTTAINYTSAPIRYNINRSAELLTRLKKVKRFGQDRWNACCPAHDDKNPSLCIRDDNGVILLFCHAGCSAYEIVSAIGLNMSDLFPPSDDSKYIKRSRQGFSAWQLLHVMKTDLIRLHVIANMLHEAGGISGDYRDFTSDVILRLYEAISYLEGGR